MLDARHNTRGQFRAVVPSPLPVARLLTGRPAEEVVEMLPRIFNLCRVAQGTAARLAVGKGKPDHDALMSEIANEHIRRLTILLPARLGLDPLAARKTWRAEDLFGGPGFPATPAEFDRFLLSRSPIGCLLREVRALFSPGEAVTDRLPVVHEESALVAVAVENSVAARHISHPVLRHIEATFGRGPLWRVTALAIDCEAVMTGRGPRARLVSPGFAVVPAARGLYAVEVRTREGRVVGIRRVTPTDHMLAPGGALAQSLASLSGTDHHRAELVKAVLDPCVPVRLERAQHA